MERMTRDNFDPQPVLKQLANPEGLSEEEANRLLEEACHAHLRLQHEHQRMILQVRAALPSV